MNNWIMHSGYCFRLSVEQNNQLGIDKDIWSLSDVIVKLKLHLSDLINFSFQRFSIPSLIGQNWILTEHFRKQWIYFKT